MTRHHYQLSLHGGRLHLLVPNDLVLRQPSPTDIEALADLMLDAYRGTIDYEDEGTDEALAEVRSYFGGSPLLAESVLLESEGHLVSACLATRFESEALVGYVMTAASAKGNGYGRLVTVATLSRLQEAGYEVVHAWITEGNTPSERIFRGLGFEVVD